MLKIKYYQATVWDDLPMKSTFTSKATKTV